MRVSTASLALALFCLVAGAAAAPAVLAQARTLDRIVAVVNDDLILASELDEESELMRQQLRQQGEQIPPGDVLREHMLDELIAQRLQLQRARQYGITVDDNAVNRALEQLAEENNTDLTGLREAFVRQGIDFATLRSDVRTQLTIQQLRQRAVASQISISEEAINDFLARLDQAEEAEEVEYRVQHILISPSGGGDRAATEAARAEAEALTAELREGADFAAMAAEHSAGPQALSGGDLGWRARDQLPALFLDALEGLAPREIAHPVESANGFHILKLAERRGGAEQTITETRGRHILIRADDDSETSESEAREQISALRERLDAGASFSDLARGHSQDPESARAGGDLGWFGPGDMTPAFHDVVDELGVGELSKPFRTESGWHIVEIQDRRQLDDAERHRRGQARQALFRERLQEETQRWLRELRDESFVDKRLNTANGRN